MPKIWNETIAAHRAATAALVAEHGLTGVAMSQIAKPGSSASTSARPVWSSSMQP